MKKCTLRKGCFSVTNISKIVPKQKFGNVQKRCKHCYISVYVELRERWGKFEKVYPMYSGTELLALALEEFMEKYDESSVL